MIEAALEAGSAAPDFELEATGGNTIRLSDLQGQAVVLYFYPKDHTPGCTTEGQDFRNLYKKFKRCKTHIFGISRDSLKTHENFKAKHQFPFELIADPDEVACQLYDVMKLKNMYGRKVRGIERSTFLIDADGKVQQVWRKVRVANHAAEVLGAAKALAG